MVEICEITHSWFSLDLTNDKSDWFRQWLGAIRQQAISWANLDSDLYRHMASIGYNELTKTGIQFRDGYNYIHMLKLADSFLKSDMDE